MTAPLTNEQLDELERLEKEATKGPWTTYEHRAYNTSYHILGPITNDRGQRNTLGIWYNHQEAGFDICSQVNCELSAAARNALPALISAARRLGEVEARAATVAGALDLLIAHRLMPELGLAVKDDEFRRGDLRMWCQLVDAIKALGEKP